jgi:hypothetical protein
MNDDLPNVQVVFYPRMEGWAMVIAPPLHLRFLRLYALL